MKNFKINKKKVMALFLAMGISVCSHTSFAEGNNIVRINGTKVNVRTSQTTSTKENIIGRVNTGDTFTISLGTVLLVASAITVVFGLFMGRIGKNIIMIPSFNMRRLTLIRSCLTNTMTSISHNIVFNNKK